MPGARTTRARGGIGRLSDRVIEKILVCVRKWLATRWCTLVIVDRVTFWAA
jgi:hypothetical protein